MSDRIDHGSRPWKAIPRDTLRDPQLSHRARGGLVAILSHDESKVRSVIGILRREGARCGREEARAIMRELATVGYAVMEQQRGSGGRFSTGYTVYAEKHVPAAEPTTSPGAVAPSTVPRGAVKPSPKELEPRELQPPVLGVDLEPQTLDAVGKDLSPGKPAPNGKGKNGTPFHLADVLNLGQIVALVDRYAAWESSLTSAYLTALVLGSKSRRIPAFGARAVNAAIESLYENAASVSDPAAYLRKVAASAPLPDSSSSSDRGVR